MVQYFVNVIPYLKVDNPIILNLQNRICGLTGKDKTIALIGELDRNILIARKEDIPYYHLFIAHCHLLIGSELYKVEEHAKIAVENFSVCHMQWNEAIGHWYLGVIFRNEIEYYFYLEELNKALEIVRSIYSEKIDQGNYEEAKNCERFEKQWEKEKTFAEAQSSTTSKKSRYHWVKPPENAPFPSSKEIKSQTSISPNRPEDTPFPSSREIKSQISISSDGQDENSLQKDQAQKFKEIEQSGNHEVHIRRIIIPVDVRALQDKVLDAAPLESDLFEELKKYDELIENHGKKE